MGLGYYPGEACVVSSYRVFPSSSNKHHFTGRMMKLALHEAGHCLGASHCSAPRCIMQDAGGKMHLDKL
jgi:archaemetzincin